MQGRKKKPVDIRKAIETMFFYLFGGAVMTIGVRIMLWPSAVMLTFVLRIEDVLAFWEGSMGKDFELVYLILSGILLLFLAPVVPLKRNVAYPLLCTVYSAVHLLHSFHTGAEGQFGAKIFLMGAALSVLFLTIDRRLEPAGFAAVFLLFGSAQYQGCAVTALDLHEVMFTPFGPLIAFVAVCLLGLLFDAPFFDDIRDVLEPRWFIPLYLMMLLIKNVIRMLLLPFRSRDEDEADAEPPEEHHAG